MATNNTNSQVTSRSQQVMVDHAQLLSTIRKQRNDNPLSILALAEPLLNSSNQSTSTKENNTNNTRRNGTSGDIDAADADKSTTRTSYTSHDSTSDPTVDAGVTPSSLALDLAHYRELFAKLRFSYLEQVTKEKYLRGIVGEPPVVSTSEDNAVLEDKLALMKEALQCKKRESEDLLGQIELQARDVAARHVRVTEQLEQLETLPREIEALEEKVEMLRAQVKEREVEEEEEDEGEEGDEEDEDDSMEIDRNEEGGGDGDEAKEEAEGKIRRGDAMNLSLEATEAVLKDRQKRSRDLDAQIEELQRSLPSRTRECEKAERELAELETRRNEVTRSAREMQRMKEEGGRDLLEEQGRWYRGSEIVLKGLLGVEV